MTSRQSLLIAEALLCFSGITYLLFFVALLFVERTIIRSPMEGLALLIIFSGILGLFGVFRLADKLIFNDGSKIGGPTYFFVNIGISTALLPALMGLLSGNIPLILIGWTSIISACHLIFLSKQTKLASADSIECNPENASPDLLSIVRNALKTILSFLLFLFIAPALFLTLWTVSRELVVAWYGSGLEERAKEQAENIADEKEYCLIASRGATSFEELDKREIIIDAFDKHFGHDSFVLGFSMRNPHFGIKVDDIPYYWSFGEDRFVRLLGYAGDERCAEDKQPRFFGRSPL